MLSQRTGNSMACAVAVGSAGFVCMAVIAFGLFETGTGGKRDNMSEMI